MRPTELSPEAIWRMSAGTFQILGSEREGDASQQFLERVFCQETENHINPPPPPDHAFTHVCNRMSPHVPSQAAHFCYLRDR